MQENIQKNSSLKGGMIHLLEHQKDVADVMKVLDLNQKKSDCHQKEISQHYEDLKSRMDTQGENITTNEGNIKKLSAIVDNNADYQQSEKEKLDNKTKILADMINQNEVNHQSLSKVVDENIGKDSILQQD